MTEFDLALFHWIAAGFTPDAIVLKVATAAAVHGGWFAFLVMAWTALWRKPERFYLLLTLGVGALAGRLAHGIAALLEAPRPFMLGLSPDYISHGARGSMPSAHASVLLTLAAVMLLRPSLRARGGAVAGIGLVTCWGRVHLGVHFPFDILAGALLALCMAGTFEGVRRTFLMALPAVRRSARRLHAAVM